MSPSGASYYCSLLTRYHTHMPTHTGRLDTYKCGGLSPVHTPEGTCVSSLCILGSLGPQLSFVMQLSLVGNGCPQHRDTHLDTETHHKFLSNNPPPTHVTHKHNSTHPGWYTVSPTHFSLPPSICVYYSLIHTLWPPWSRESEKIEPEPTCLIGLHLSKQQ